MNAPLVRLVNFEGYERPYRLRMPFRFGVKTATHGRQAIIKVRIRLEDGREAEGYSAEALGAKWFDKDLSLSDDDNHDQLRKALELAGEAYGQSGASTPFDLFADNYENHVEACSALDLNPLIASFGQSMLDRAVLDALLRILDVDFYQGMRSNIAGLDNHRVVPELDGFPLQGLFEKAAPAATIDVRHTVGLADPVTAGDLPKDARVNDGLPETLEEVVSFYGNRYFKIKVGGNEEEDTDRLTRIASVLDAGGADYQVTLDGNEQYPDAECFAAFYRGLSQNAKLKRFLPSVLYVEQPINRKEAFARSVEAMGGFAPVIIDESDGALSAFVMARELGYSGVSSKACKGIYKSMLNHARCLMWNEAAGAPKYFMSAEDLTCEPGIAIQQDLALVNLLGLTHVERNAHHFIDGFDDRPRAEAEAFLEAHPDLYHEQDGRVRLKIAGGKFEIGSLSSKGYASALAPGLDEVQPMARSLWRARTSGDA